jgi:hypothetical protein
VEARPLGRTLELGDVPRPDLIGRNSEQLGLGVGRVGELVAPLATAAVGRQQPVHRAHRAEVATLVEQRRMHGRRRRVGKAVAVEGVEQRLVLDGVECERWARARGTGHRRPHQRCAVRSYALTRWCAAPQAQGATGRAGAERRGEFVHGGHQILSPFSSSVKPIKEASFFWTSMTSMALSSRRLSRSTSRVSWAMCRASARFGSTLGPRF